MRTSSMPCGYCPRDGRARNVAPTSRRLTTWPAAARMECRVTFAGPSRRLRPSCHADGSSAPHFCRRVVGATICRRVVGAKLPRARRAFPDRIQGEYPKRIGIDLHLSRLEEVIRFPKSGGDKVTQPSRLCAAPTGEDVCRDRHRDSHRAPRSLHRRGRRS